MEQNKFIELQLEKLIDQSSLLTVLCCLVEVLNGKAEISIDKFSDKLSFEIWKSQAEVVDKFTRDFSNLLKLVPNN